MALASGTVVAAGYGMARNPLLVRLALSSFVAVFALLPLRAAVACGGLFCDAVAPVLEPVEQNAERILFEVGEDTVTVIVEIGYTGVPDEFSWVVPIPEVPALEVVPPSTLLLLDDATAPTLTQQPTSCRDRAMGCNAMGANPAALLSGCAADYGMADYDGGVQVVELPQTGPYESEAVSSDNPGDLIDWLNNNGYLITEEMEPAVAGYVAQGMWFLCMKLAQGASVADIAPISMTYSGTEPSIPLVLTSVSAEPEMGILVLIAGDQRYQSSGWANLLVDPQDIRADPTLQSTNYYPLVSYLVDQLGGRAFITQYAGVLDDRVADARNMWGGQYAEEDAWLASLAMRHTELTRMYTRISGWEMTSDPTFEPSPGGPVSNLLDLSNNEPVEICAESPMDAPCGSTYCGEGATCATTQIGDGCVCPVGTVARRIESPELNGLPLFPTVSCQRLDFDLMSSLDDEFIGGGSDPCLDFDCGPGGTCEAVNGMATCACAEGGAAVATFDGMECVEAIDIYAPEDSLLPAVDTGVEVADNGDPAGLALAFVLMLLPAAMFRLRRRS